MNAPIRIARGDTTNPSFIRELCIALEHRWRAESLFLILTAYFDEADSHGGANALTMAAFLGTGREWELLGRRLRGLQRQYGFKTFHATELKGKRGEFKGWSDEKCQNLVGDLTEAVRKDLTDGVTVSLSREQYLSEYRNTPFPPKMPVDSQWGLCFRACMAQIAGTVGNLKGKNRVHVVVEEGHRNVGAARVIFREQQKALLENGRDLFGTVTIEKKSRCEPLMLADFLAHTFKMFDDNQRVTGKGYADLTGAMPRKSEAGLSILRFPPGVLQGLKDNYQRAHEERQAAHLRRREAWLAAKKASEEQSP